ncbi:hypothetical protein BJ912DRAFT_950735, partial [Pholiota molesta]
MSNLTNAIQFSPNPDTPLAFVQPAAAYQISVATYLRVASLAVMIWDILDNVSNDSKLLFRTRIGVPTVVYFVSRFGSLAYALSGNIFSTAGTGNCIHFETVTDAFYPISISCTALLFFFRLRAIYNQDRIVVVGFFLLWLGVLASTILIPIGILGGYIGNTKYCVDVDVPNSAYAGIFAPLIHDTMVFLAISWRLARNSHMEMNFQEGIKVAIFGRYLPTFTKSLLRDGQRYYLISLISNLVVVVMVFDTSVPIPLRSMGAMSNVVVTNIMASRVFRRTKFGQLMKEGNSATKFQGNDDGQLPSFPVFAHDTRNTDRSQLQEGSRN